MGNICKILGIPFNNITYSEAVILSLLFLEEEKHHMIFTPNPEIVMEARKDKELFNILNKADLVVPDGIGIVKASLFTQNKIKERVAGFDLVQGIFKNIRDTKHTVYFLGGGKDIAKQAKINMEKKYSGLKIIGVHDGYFNNKEEKIIIEQIKSLKPDILLVGIGSPKQEKWIYKHRKELPVKISIGVGGSFDIMSGKSRRAPKIFIKFGLEWFYRLITQPTRFVRMLKLPMFMAVVLKEKVTKRDKNK